MKLTVSHESAYGLPSADPDVIEADEVLSEGRGERPTCLELADWLSGSDCSPAAVTAVCERMTALLGSEVAPPFSLVNGVITAPGALISVRELWDEYRRAVDAGEAVRWPLAPLVNAWQSRPRPVEPNRRLTGRIIPARLAMSSPAYNQRMLFSPAAHAGYDSDGEQLVMPGFGRSDTPSPALPLALYELGSGPTSSPGRGAPLALRMFVESVLSVPMKERERGQPVAVSVSLREFLGWLYPARKPTPSEYWPRLMTAVEALDSWDARIPLYDPQTQRNELRRVVSVGGIPRGPKALDESVRIVVDLPSGSGNGPQVSDNLRLWGVRSAPCYRLLINLAYQWHDPGVTRVPVGRGRSRHWVQAEDPDRYPLISDADLVSLAFPTTPGRSEHRWPSEAWGYVRQLEKAGELRVVEGKILPPSRRAVADPG